MKKIADFIVNKRYFVLAVMLVICIACALMIPQVTINTDMTKYLPDDSSMREGMNIMAEEFPDNTVSNTIRVMFEGLTEEEKTDILASLGEIKYVDSVTYDAESCNKDGYTLYTVATQYDYDSKEETSIEKAIKENYSDYGVVVKNDNASTTELPMWLIALAFGLLMVVLFAMCGSWAEPFVFLLAIGVAIVINMGTNLALESVSTMTFSIAAILQVVLSMDYSIILMNRYRQEKELTEDKLSAMKSALHHAFSSITSSGMTTVIGLLMLVFMSFKIGMDLGLVLAKGVLCSMLCVFTVLPVLILLFDKIITKTAKKELNVPMGWMATVSRKCRYVIMPLFVILFIASAIVQNYTDITYTIGSDDEIAKIFPSSNPIVVLYDNEDEEAIAELAEELQADEKINSVMGYSTTLGKAYTAEEMAAMIDSMGLDMDIDSSLVSILYYDYYNDGKLPEMTFGQFCGFVSQMSDGVDEETATYLAMFAQPEVFTYPMDAASLAQTLGTDELAIQQIFMLCYGTIEEQTMSVKDYIDFVLSDPTLAGQLDESTAQQLVFMQTLINTALSEETYTAEEMYAFAGALSDELSEGTVELIYLCYGAANDSDPEWALSIDQLFNYLSSNIMSKQYLMSFMDTSSMGSMLTMKKQLDDGISQMKGENYSLLALDTSYAVESSETTDFMASLISDCDASLKGNYYLIGNTPMNYEMAQSFDSEMLFITLLTAIAIFIVVAVTFRSMFVPLILVLIVQCGVYITIAVNGLLGYSMYYLAMLIVQCILMGATIDYGILFTNYYRENRSTMESKDALKAAYKGSIHTILTSALIMIIVTGVIGLSPAVEATIAQICQTIAIGALSATLLILFVLPGLLAAFDKLVVRKKK